MPNEERGAGTSETQRRAGPPVRLAADFDFSDIDNAICDHVRVGSGHPTNSSILERIVLKHVDVAEPWKIIARRMRVLSKGGRLVWVKSGRKPGWTAPLPQPE